MSKYHTFRMKEAACGGGLPLSPIGIGREENY